MEYRKEASTETNAYEEYLEELIHAFSKKECDEIIRNGDFYVYVKGFLPDHKLVEIAPVFEDNKSYVGCYVSWIDAATSITLFVNAFNYCIRFMKQDFKTMDEE